MHGEHIPPTKSSLPRCQRASRSGYEKQMEMLQQQAHSVPRSPAKAAQ